MNTKSKTVRLPAALAEAAELRAQMLGYPNLTAYVKGLMRYDCLVQGRHTITLPYADLPASEQDKLDDKFLELTKRGVGERGQLLTRIIERAKEKGSNVVKGQFAA